MTTTIIETRMQFTMVLDELLQKSIHKQMDMNKSITKKLFMDKVLNELKTHPYYMDNKKFFDKLIHKLPRIEKQIAIKDIMRLLEENFKYKIQHKKKFHSVIQELHLHFHKQKFQPVLEELLMKNKTISEKHPDNLEYFFLSFVVAIVAIHLYGKFLNWFDN